MLPVRRDVAGLCMFYKIYHNLSHPLNDVVFAPTRRLRHTRAAVLAHDFEVQLFRCRTAQFERCFVISMGKLWNSLSGEVFDSGCCCIALTPRLSRGGPPKPQPMRYTQQYKR